MSTTDLTPGVLFIRLLRTELRKLTDTRSGRWLLIAVLVTTPLVVVGMLLTSDPANLTYDRFVDFTATAAGRSAPAGSGTSRWFC